MPPARPFGVYVHVPFCAARCGYCDFNTYTAGELAGSGASPDGWLDAVRRELADGRTVVGGRRRPTPCSWAAARRRCSAPRGWRTCSPRSAATFGLAPGAEVTTEANPESTSPEFFAALADAGLHPGLAGHAVGRAARAAVLDRRHTPGRAVAAAREAARPGSSTSTST